MNQDLSRLSWGPRPLFCPFEGWVPLAAVAAVLTPGSPLSVGLWGLRGGGVGSVLIHIPTTQKATRVPDATIQHVLFRTVTWVGGSQADSVLSSTPPPSTN